MPLQILFPFSYHKEETETLDYIAQYYFDGQTGDDWPIVSNATTSADTTNWETPRNGVNQALAVTPTGSTFANIAMTLSPTLDLSNAQGVMRVYLNPNDGGLDGNSASKVIAVGLRLRPSGGTLTLKTIWSINQQVTKGWLDITFDIPSLFNTITLTAIDQVYVTVSYDSGYTGAFTLGYLAFWQRPVRARVLLRLDDGGSGLLQLAAIANSYNIPVHFGIIQDLIGHTNFLTLSEIQQIRDMTCGHIVCNHSNLIQSATGGTNAGWRWQDAGQTILTPIVTRRDDVTSCRNYLVANGLSEGAKSFIVPGGFDQRDDVDLINDDTIDYIWYAGLDSQVTHIWPPQWILHRRWRIPGGQILDNQDSYASFVTTAVTNKTFAVLYGHNLDSTKWETMCQEIVTQRAAGNLRVVTLRHFA